RRRSRVPVPGGVPGFQSHYVAAASSDVPHTWWINSNFGSRIDCYGWGDGVFTSMSTGPGVIHSYTPPWFVNTSAAAATIAGAASSVQGMAHAVYGSRFSP